PGCPQQGEGKRPRARGGPQLYDTPYEGWEKAAEGAGGATARDSRLPRDDERPADEYDQPWEWKKDHISRAFAGPRGTAQPRVLMGPSGRGRTEGCRWVLGSRVLCFGVLCFGVLCFGVLCFGVTAAPCRWYHGPIGRAGAETLLALCREGSFLVRDCETSPEDYSLSLRSSHGFVHVKLTRTRERHFVLGRAGAAFPSVPEAVRHYTARALPIRGARHLSLLYPVAAQPP
ncbi:SHD protein, partial [Asarcornis scutulata]|nr:SHD protein [Asarcornis scutulata]